MNFKFQISHPARKILFLVLFWNGTLNKGRQISHASVDMENGAGIHENWWIPKALPDRYFNL